MTTSTRKLKQSIGISVRYHSVTTRKDSRFSLRFAYEDDDTIKSRAFYSTNLPKFSQCTSTLEMALIVLEDLGYEVESYFVTTDQDYFVSVAWDSAMTMAGKGWPLK